MRRVTRRIYGRDDSGRRVLLYAPGAVITDEEAERVALVAEPEPEKPEGWWTKLERRDPPPVPFLQPSLSRMTLAELRGFCDDEGVDPGGANTRAEYIAAIEAAGAAGESKA